mmetsp:Transcript_7472/g.11171  ORF Transcript_7472/g.11171 Transcript_7472/m.11171 type:complete len:118 (+) Transcript_7472:78-431(+)
MFALRSLISSKRSAFQNFKRGLAGNHAVPEYTGIEAKVRKIFVKDEHLVLGIIGFYTIFGMGLKLIFGGGDKSVEEDKSHLSKSIGGDEIPSADSENFDKWIEVPGNADKWFESFEK